MSDTWDRRLALLRKLNERIYEMCADGTLLGEPVRLLAANSVCGPRAGALEISAGAHTGQLMSKLAQHDAALLRQLIPWEFPKDRGAPDAFMSGRLLRLEAGWPENLAEMTIRLDQLGRCPGDKADRWTVGMNEHGDRVTTSLCDATPHFLFAGQTGSGKTVAARNASLQLAHRDNRLVLCDGKRGESLHVAAHWQGVMGPLAVDVQTVRNALGWAYTEMMRRYERITQGEQHHGLVVVIFDEFQTFTDDAVVSALMREISAMGRAASVHLIGMTQQPTLSAFGKDERSRTTTRRQMPGRIALQVADFDTSRVVVGSSVPRADRLLGAGDAYLIDAGLVRRVQCAYVDERDFAQAPTGEWEFDEWPAFDPANIGIESDGTADTWDETEAAIGILTAAQGNRGRPALLDLFTEYERAQPGTDKARRLLAWGRRVWKVLKDAPELADYCRGVE